MALRSESGTPLWKSELPPLPKWNLPKIKLAAEILFEAVIRPWRNCTFTPDTRCEIAEMLMEHYKLRKKESAMAAVETLLPYGERLMTKELARLLCYQFAANLDRIRVGTPIQRFTGVAEAVWMPMEITGFQKLERGRKPWVTMAVRVLDGVYAGFPAHRHMPLGYVAVFANDLGYSRKRQYEEPADLIDFRFAAWVEPSQSTDLQFDKYWLTAAMAKFNNQLTVERKPTDKELYDAED